MQLISIRIRTHQNANQKLTIGSMPAHRAQCTLPSQSILQTLLSRVPKIDFWCPSYPSTPGMTGHCCNVMLLRILHKCLLSVFDLRLMLSLQVGRHATSTQMRLWRSCLVAASHTPSHGSFPLGGDLQKIKVWYISGSCVPEPCVSISGLLLILVPYTLHYLTN